MTIHLMVRWFVFSLAFVYTMFKLERVFSIRKTISFCVSVVIFLLMSFWLFIYHKNVVPMDSNLFKILSAVGSIAISVWATFMMLTFLGDIFWILICVFKKMILNKNGLRSGQETKSLFQERRDFFKKALPLSLVGLTGTLSAIGYQEAKRGAKLKKVSLKSSKTHFLRGLKIAQISDLHVGLTIWKDYVQHVVDLTLKDKPDIIVITGDMVDGSPGRLQEHVAPLRNLKAPLGVFYITGNHEYYSGAEAWIQEARDMGFIPLINENKILEFNGFKFMMAGVTDTSSHNFIADQVSDPILAAKSPEEVIYKILLAHRPESYKDAEKAGFDLQLSGHTHAGQFFPATLFIPFFHKYYKGLNRHNDLCIYVNPGTGYWGPANRLGVPAEITLFEFS